MCLTTLQLSSWVYEFLLHDCHSAMAPDTEEVRVVVQARPLLPFEEVEGAQHVLSMCSQPSTVTLTRPAAPAVSFSGFDAVYDEHSHRDELFTEHVRPLVMSVFDGINATAFAYGQTSAGKSYTMDRLVENVAKELFERVRTITNDQTVSVTVRVGFVEIYKEKIRDLVDGTNAPLGTVNINVRERPGGGVFLDGARERVVQSHDELMRIIRDGALLRQTASTGMNSRSSRSHSVITVSVQLETLGEARPRVLSAKLNMVDLAGSERAKRTGTGGERFTEGVEINKGLFSLAKVISALADNSRPNQRKHVPYRDSKLTRLLQDSLGGTARTLLIACVSPADTSREETIGTLRYAARAKSIRNRPRVNVDANAVEISDLRAALARARAQVAALAEENDTLRGRLGIVKGRRKQTRATNTQDGATPVSTEPLIIRRENYVSSNGLVDGRRFSETDSPKVSNRSVGLAALSRTDMSPGSRRESLPSRRSSDTASKRKARSPAAGGGRSVSAHVLPKRRALREEDENVDNRPHNAQVEHALNVARTDEMRRAFSQRTARLEKDKAALDRERQFLLRKMSTLQSQHEKTVDDLKATQQSRIAAMRTKLADVKRLAGECTRLRKQRDEAERARAELVQKLKGVQTARDELVSKLAHTLSKVEHVKRALGKENRDLTRSEQQVRIELQRATVIRTRQDAVVSRLQEENEVLKRKLREISRTPGQRPAAHVVAQS